MSIRQYVCQFRIHNFTYIYRCRAEDQYCCGYTCCFKPLDQDPAAALLYSWYFWSLISLVVVVFGCIILSFALSSLKRKSSSWARTPSAWLGLMSGGSVNFGHLATTTVGRSGIIQPSIMYKKKVANISSSDDVAMPTSQDMGGNKCPGPSSQLPETASPLEDTGWVQKQLKPLSAPYRSAWNGEQPIEIRLHPAQASSNVNAGMLPPGFINT